MSQHWENITLACNNFRKALIFLVLVSGFCSGQTYAALISTDALINQGESYTKADLHTALASAELKAQLQTMGVDVEQLNDRIASLTPSEILALNTRLQQAPAGGILGTLATIFIVLIVTDMLCATDIFTFVKCINK